MRNTSGSLTQTAENIEYEFKYATLIASILLVTFSVLIFLALLSELFGTQIIGKAGTGMAAALNYVFGIYLAFGVPFFLGSISFVIWPRRIPKQLPLIAEGLFLCLISLMALLGISVALADPTLSITQSGAIGTFMMHSRACNLTGLLGNVGSYLMFASFLLIGVILATNRNPLASVRNFLRNFSFRGLREKITNLFFIDTYANDEGEEEDGDELYEDEYETEPAPKPKPSIFNLSQLMKSRSSKPEGEPQPEVASLTGSRLFRSGMLSTSDITPEPFEPTQSVQPIFDAVAPTATKDEMLAPEEMPFVLEPMEMVEVLPENRTDAPGTVEPLKPATRKRSTPQPASNNTAAAGGVTYAPEYIDVYDLPGTSLLTLPPRIDTTANEAEAQRGAYAIAQTLENFNVPVIISNIVMGPSVTRYEIKPAAGVKIERITSLENNLTMAMQAKHLRIIAPIPGKDAIGVEVPNRTAQPVFLSELLNSEAFRASTAPLAFALGKTIDGQSRVLDLAKMPHLLIAGTTGSGKSVCLNSVIVSILFHMPPSRVKMIMIDPKQVELSVYRDIPHLLAPVVTNPQNAAAALSWACEEMEERLFKMSQIGVRNIDGYNSYIKLQPNSPAKPEIMPHLVVIIDELADLMLVAKKDVEDSIIRLAQKARAAGIHLILATQRPTVNVITGLIKANFPARIAFQVASYIDSRTILDVKGAEALQGRGDMLFATPGSLKPERVQGCYVSDAEVEAVADFVRTQAKPTYHSGILGDDDDDSEYTTAGEVMKPEAPWNDDRFMPQAPKSANGARRRPIGGPAANGSNVTETMCEDDKVLYEEAIRLVLTSKQGSQSMLQRRMRVGFAKAGWLMDQMETEGIVGPSQNGRVRNILVDPDTFLASRGWLEETGPDDE